MSNTEELLGARGKTHGDFATVARIHEEVMTVWFSSPNWDRLTNAQKLSLTMINSKIARILCGDQYETDHWKDIAGYATLIANAKKGDK